MKQCNLLSEKDNATFRKAYQSPSCDLGLFDETKDVLMLSTTITSVEWVDGWDGFLTGKRGK